MIAMGIILILLGVPFVGMAVMTAALLSQELRYGLTVALATLTVVFLISDITGALMAAIGSGFLSSALRRGRSMSASVMTASAATAIASIFGVILLPEMSILSQENLNSLMTLYSSAGLSTSEVIVMLEVLVYVLPAVMAVWAACGVMAAAAAAKLIAVKRGGWRKPSEKPQKISLGLLPAWILILALGLNLMGGRIPPVLQRAAVNVSIFMVLPYSAVGVSVCRKFLALYPQSLILVLVTGVIFPPLALGLLALTGVLDTWLDLRALMNRKMERNSGNEDTSD